jgi:PAS domain S-box-containing protein
MIGRLVVWATVGLLAAAIAGLAVLFVVGGLARDAWEQIDRLSDWVGPHLAERSTELTVFAVATIVLLVVVRFALLLIMRMQRPWDRMQRALFWLLAADEAFWAYLLYQQVRTIRRLGWVGTYPFRVLLLLAGLLVTSAWFMFEIDRRYRRGRDDGERAPATIGALASEKLVVVSGDDDRIAWADPDGAALFGYRPQELIGQDVTVLIPARLRARHLAGRRHFHATGEGPLIGKTARVPALTKGGAEVPVCLELVPMRVGEARWIVAVLTPAASCGAWDVDLVGEAGMPPVRPGRQAGERT